jgi:hypothetical protein
MAKLKRLRLRERQKVAEAFDSQMRRLIPVFNEMMAKREPAPFARALKSGGFAPQENASTRHRDQDQ